MNPEFSKSGEMVSASLRGYRSWRVDVKPQILLKSVGITSMSWPTKELEAKCAYDVSGKGHSSSPYEECKCGIYGWYQPEWTSLYHSGSVMGVVEYSGKILMGTRGFRAEKAKIVAITHGKDIISGIMAQIYKSLAVVNSIEGCIEVKSGFYEINYNSLQRTLKEAYEEVLTDNCIFKQIASKYDVEYFENVDSLVESYPPQLDTIENVIGKKLERYE